MSRARTSHFQCDRILFGAEILSTAYTWHRTSCKKDQAILYKLERAGENIFSLIGTHLYFTRCGLQALEMTCAGVGMR